MARLRQYPSNADRQKAYRDRARLARSCARLAPRVAALDSRLSLSIDSEQLAISGLGAPAAFTTIDSCAAWIAYQETHTRRSEESPDE